MKKGDRAYLHYDGKNSRQVIGKCTQSRGFAVKIKFKGWADDKVHECWFVQRNKTEYYKKVWWCGYVRDVDGGVHKWLGCPGDYYSVYSEDIKY